MDLQKLVKEIEQQHKVLEEIYKKESVRISDTVKIKDQIDAKILPYLEKIKDDIVTTLRIGTINVENIVEHFQDDCTHYPLVEGLGLEVEEYKGNLDFYIYPMYNESTAGTYAQYKDNENYIAHIPLDLESEYQEPIESIGCSYNVVDILNIRNMQNYPKDNDKDGIQIFTETIAYLQQTINKEMAKMLQDKIKENEEIIAMNTYSYKLPEINGQYMFTAKDRKLLENLGYSEKSMDEMQTYLLNPHKSIEMDINVQRVGKPETKSRMTDMSQVKGLLGEEQFAKFIANIFEGNTDNYHIITSDNNYQIDVNTHWLAKEDYWER